MTYLDQMAELLRFHRALDPDTPLTQHNLKAHVTLFQEKADLFADGIPGPNTLWALQEPYYADKAALDIVGVEADPAPPGIEALPRFNLRIDAAASFRDICAEARAAGAIMLSSGGQRPLSEGANASRSAISMHYPAIAVDMCINAGFFNPKTDPYVLVPNGTRRFTVYARATQGTDMTLNAVDWTGSWSNGKVKRVEVSGKFIDLTSLMAKYGWRPIGARRCYTRAENKRYLCSEWWHFQYEFLLTPRISQIGIEVLRISGITAEKIQQLNPALWERRKEVFKKGWN